MALTDEEKDFIYKCELRSLELSSWEQEFIANLKEKQDKDWMTLSPKQRQACKRIAQKLDKNDRGGVD